VLVGLVFVVGGACATPVPPGVVDPGRGALPLDVGTTRVGVIAAAAVPFPSFGSADPPTAGAAGVRFEHQLVDGVAVGAKAEWIGVSPYNEWGGRSLSFTTVQAITSVNLWTPHVALRTAIGAGTIGLVDAFAPYAPFGHELHLDADVGLVASGRLLHDVVETYAFVDLGVSTTKWGRPPLYPAGGGGASFAIRDGVRASAALVVQGVDALPLAVYGTVGVALEL
jgi:hypothetical protein